MSAIHGKEPFHWHTEDGKHNMKDPRKIPGYQRAYWDSDERDYVSHLEAHERAETSPERSPEDTEQISALFDLIENLGGQVRTARALIANLRRKAQQESEEKKVQHSGNCSSNWETGAYEDPYKCSCGAES